jgi:hypothetical protein
VMFLLCMWNSRASLTVQPKTLLVQEWHVSASIPHIPSEVCSNDFFLKVSHCSGYDKNNLYVSFRLRYPRKPSWNLASVT